MQIKLKEPLNTFAWHEKFIIWPRIIERKLVFLETVFARQRTGWHELWWEYSLIDMKGKDES